jgi:hypothetical protein
VCQEKGRLAQKITDMGAQIKCSVFDKHCYVIVLEDDEPAPEISFFLPSKD